MRGFWGRRLPLLTVICGEAGHSIRTTEGTDWAESKWQWRHLCGEKTFSASKKVNSRRKKKGSQGCSDGSRSEGRHDRTIAGERKERVEQKKTTFGLGKRLWCSYYTICRVPIHKHILVFQCCSGETRANRIVPLTIVKMDAFLAHVLVY